MMYCEKLVACVKVDGKVVREEGDKIYLPFGSDYSIYLKNLHTATCKIAIEIDGQDVLDDSNILLYPKKSVDLMGFLKGGEVTNCFRFIEKTKQISKHRGDNPEDGLIVITYQFQQIAPTTIAYVSSNSHTWYDSNSGSTPSTVAYSARCCANTNLNEKGITVPGAETSQSFTQVYDGSLYGPTNTIVFHLLGKNKNKKIKNVVTTRQKLQCPTCGTKNKASSKFCSNCGTFMKH